MGARTTGRIGRANFLKKGDHNVICDRTGFKLKASDCKLEWNGLFVRAESWESRHPQDFLRAFPDDQTVPIARPPQEPYFLSDGEVKAEDL